MNDVIFSQAEAEFLRATLDFIKIKVMELKSLLSERDAVIAEVEKMLKKISWNGNLLTIEAIRDEASLMLARIQALKEKK